jgi:hypothetical protein
MVPASNCVIFRFTIADGEEFSFGLNNIGRTAPSLSLNVKVVGTGTYRLARLKLTAASSAWAWTN